MDDISEIARTQVPWRAKGQKRVWSLRTFCVVIYLLVSLPTLVSLCFVTGPFQAPDEVAHFLRAVQLSHGQALPIPSSNHRFAGGYIDRSAGLLAWNLGMESVAVSGPRRFHVADVLKMGDQQAPGPLVYAPFSNTAIYFPIAHAVPALAISIARGLGAPPLAWFYSGRLANALIALGVSAVAIFLFEETSLFALVVCTLPMVLFEEASLAPDALVVAFGVLFAALIARIARGARLTAWDYGALGLCLIYVTVAKFAYMPLAWAAPLVALIQRRDPAVLARLGLLSALAVGLWLAWSITIQSNVLSGRLDRTDVDVHRQLALVLRHPLTYLAVFSRTLAIENIHPINQMIGSKLGALNVPMPKWTSTLALVDLIVVSVWRAPIKALQAPARWIIAVLALGSLMAAFLLLYLQFTPVGQPWIDGFQGRYILPVLALLPLVVTGWPAADRSAKVIRLASPLACAIGAAATVAVVTHAYWV